MVLPRVSGQVVQMCFIVEDLDKAVGNWITTVGAGPFFVQKDLEGVAVEYRGISSSLNMDVALGQAGSLQIELIRPRGTAPNVYTEMYPHGGTGLHHIASFVDDLDAEIEAYIVSGQSQACRGVFGGSSFAYVDTRSTVGIFTELYAESAFMRGLYSKVAGAAKCWDRSRPIRPLADVIG